MPASTHLVNLDALIRREDFRTSTGAEQTKRTGDQLRVIDLEGMYLHLIRKPDFQRETSNWSPEKIADFIKSFVDGDLIPATIMWWSPLNGSIFVIDGAHRLSALIAWVHDDYGAGAISAPFFGHSIPKEQRRLADRTQHLVNEQVGSYAYLKRLVASPHEAPDELVLRRARNAATFKVDLQWVDGDATAAENSFFRINTGQSVIDATEIDILRARNKPNAIATRALIRAGTGHKYWSRFPSENQSTIEQQAREISDGLFKPLLETPILTLDLPIAGQRYSADSFKMILDLVNMVNNVTPAMWQAKPSRGRKKASTHDGDKLLADDTDGSATIGFLNQVKKAALLISGDHPGSLGLHPVVYFYSATGRFQPGAFLATIKFALELKSQKRLIAFTQHRFQFEEFLVKYRDFTNQVNRKHGSRMRLVEPLVHLYRTVLAGLESGHSEDAIVRQLQEDPRLQVTDTVEAAPIRRRRFTVDAKSAAYIRDAIDTPLRCAICAARLPTREAISHDHKTRIADGGLGTVDNAQLTHWFCNTGYKERSVTLARRAAEG